MALHRAMQHLIYWEAPPLQTYLSQRESRGTQQSNSLYIRKHHLFGPTYHRESVGGPLQSNAKSLYIRKHHLYLSQRECRGTPQSNSLYIRKHHLFGPTYHRESVGGPLQSNAKSLYIRKHHLFRPTYIRESVVALHRATAYILGSNTSSDLPIT